MSILKTPQICMYIYTQIISSISVCLCLHTCPMSSYQCFQFKSKSFPCSLIINTLSGSGKLSSKYLPCVSIYSHAQYSSPLPIILITSCFLPCLLSTGHTTVPTFMGQPFPVSSATGNIAVTDIPPSLPRPPQMLLSSRGREGQMEKAGEITIYSFPRMGVFSELSFAF